MRRPVGPSVASRIYECCQKAWFLAKVRDAIRMATWTRRMRRFLLNNGAASPSRPCAGKYGKTSKPPRFTNLGQEPGTGSVEWGYFPLLQQELRRFECRKVHAPTPSKS